MKIRIDNFEVRYRIYADDDDENHIISGTIDSAENESYSYFIGSLEEFSDLLKAEILDVMKIDVKSRYDEAKSRAAGLDAAAKKLGNIQTALASL